MENYSRYINRYHFFVLFASITTVNPMANPLSITSLMSCLGSRSGALIAACWSALMYFGREGYVKSTKRIVTTARFIAQGYVKHICPRDGLEYLLTHFFLFYRISNIKGLRVLGEPLVSVVAFTSDEFDIYQLGELMSRKEDGSHNWSLSALQYPPALHLCVTDLHTQPGVMERLLEDLEAATETLLKSPNSKSTGMVNVISKPLLALFK